MQRRVEQPDRHRQPGHRLEDPLEVGLLHGQQPLERRAALLLVAARIISCTTGSRSGAMNMCSVRQRPMPSAPNSRAFAASSGVSAFARTRSRRSSSAQPRIVLEVLVDRGRDERHRPDDHAPCAAVDRERSPSRSSTSPIQRARLRVDRERVAAGDAGLPHPARDDSGVRGHASVRGQDSPAWIRPWMSSGVVSQRTRITSSPALPRASARSASSTIAPDAAPGEAFRPVATTSIAPRVDHRMEQLVELGRVDPGHGLLAEIELLADHLDRDPQRRRRRALAGTRLQEESAPSSTVNSMSCISR